MALVSDSAVSCLRSAHHQSASAPCARHSTHLPLVSPQALSSRLPSLRTRVSLDQKLHRSSCSSPFAERNSSNLWHVGAKGSNAVPPLDLEALLAHSTIQPDTCTRSDQSFPALQDRFPPLEKFPKHGMHGTTAGRLHSLNPASLGFSGSAETEGHGRGAFPGNRSSLNQSEDPDSSNDISLRLPELRELLEYLRRAQLTAGGADQSEERRIGRVSLVGTGPGDPELLTVKAWRLLQEADLVLYDRLVSRDVLDMIQPNARLLYVGKAASWHSRTQEEIHELLLRFAEAGANVVRLKGGDPLVFGRGGEEVEYLQSRGIHVDIIPGITSASGIAASLGIPLTHRGLANSVRFLTGHSRKGGEDPLQVAETAADPDSTLVIYMGLGTLPGIAGKLMANGLSPSTPAVAVERGTTDWQRNVFAELQDLPQAVAAAKLVSPTLVIVGHVVALSKRWPFPQRVSQRQRAERGGVSEGSGAVERQDEAVKVGRREPRDRGLRGADPLLPSQKLTNGLL